MTGCPASLSSWGQAPCTIPVAHRKSDHVPTGIADHFGPERARRGPDDPGAAFCGPAPCGVPVPEVRRPRRSRPRRAAPPVPGRDAAAGEADPPPIRRRCPGTGSRSQGSHPADDEMGDGLDRPPRPRSGRRPRAWTQAARALSGDAVEGVARRGAGQAAPGGPPIGCPRRTGKRGREAVAEGSAATSPEARENVARGCPGGTRPCLGGRGLPGSRARRGEEEQTHARRAPRGGDRVRKAEGRGPGLSSRPAGGGARGKRPPPLRPPWLSGGREEWTSGGTGSTGPRACGTDTRRPPAPRPLPPQGITGCPAMRWKAPRAVAQGKPPRARRRGRTSPGAARAGRGRGGRAAGRKEAGKEGGGGANPCTTRPPAGGSGEEGRGPGPRPLLSTGGRRRPGGPIPTPPLRPP